MKVSELTARARLWSIALGALAWIVAICVAVHIWNTYRDTIPQLDGIPAVDGDGAAPSDADTRASAYAEAIGIPWNVPITPAEQKTLREALPIGKPLFYGDLRLWLAPTIDPRLGRMTPDTATHLEAAFASLRSRDDLGRQPSDAPIAQAGRSVDVQTAEHELAAAGSAPGGAPLWVVSYNRGILHLLQGNRQHAQTELRRAASSLPNIDASKPPGLSDAELYNAVIHTDYARGHLYLATSHETSLAVNTRDEAAKTAVTLFRHAVLLSVWHWRLTHPVDVFHPAAYFPLPVTQLSTRALRNDLAATYLSAPHYRYCDAPMAPNICSQTVFHGDCGHRDERFCNTQRRIVADLLKPTYDALLSEFRDRGNTAVEPTLWALQTLVEAEAENSGLVADPLAAYNLGLLLISRNEVSLASTYLRDMSRDHERDVQVPPQVTRLRYFAAILARDAISLPPGSSSAAESRTRRAYGEIYKNIKVPPAFPSLNSDAAPETVATIDHWLFIVRYRDLLHNGLFETFNVEHDSATRALNDDFLSRWKADALASFIDAAANRYRKAKRDGNEKQAELIRRFLVESPYFDRDVVARRGIPAGMLSAKDRAWLEIAGVLALAAIFTLLLRRCNRALRDTFFSWHRYWRLKTEETPT